MALGFANRFGFTRLAVFAVVAILTVAPGHADDANSGEALSESEIALLSELLTLDWIDEPGIYDIGQTGRQIELDERFALILGDDARTYFELVNGEAREQIEAVLIDNVELTEAYYAYSDIGYVTLDDWKDVDPDDLMEGIKRATDEANRTRREVGIPEVRVRGWVTQPTLDRDAGMVYWVIEAQTADMTLLNAVALKLGRQGFEMVTWVVTPQYYMANSDELTEIANRLTFMPGQRYADYETGDLLAGFGIASLVATTVGASSSKSKGVVAAVIAFLVLVLKKAWFVVLGVIAGGIAVFRRKRRQPHHPTGRPPTT